MDHVIPMVFVSATLLTSCLAESPGTQAPPEVALASAALELGCLLVAPDAVAALGPEDPSLEILSVRPFSTSQGQDYGSLECSGFVVDIDNPDGYSSNAIFATGAGWVKSAADRSVFGTEERCRNMLLQVDYYGIRSGIPVSLGAATVRGKFLPNDSPEEMLDHCQLVHDLFKPGNYESYRVVARISNQSTTYPIRFGAW